LATHPVQAIFKPAAAAAMIPANLLARANKVLFITHFAIGDFVYMQSCFRALKQAYPRLQVHVWVDERRRTKDPAQWPHLQRYGIYDLLRASPYVDKIYDRNYSPAGHAECIAQAQREAYPIVLTLTNLHCHRYASLARKIAANAFIVGLRKTNTRAISLGKRFHYRNLDASIPLYASQTYSDSGAHISDLYADWFARAFGIDVPRSDRFPILDIPADWTRYAHEQFAEWGFARGRLSQVVFVNAFSKCKDRCWPLERAFELVREMRRHPQWRDAGFIVNVVPEALPQARALHAAQALPDTRLFCAEEHFFQLPAILALCDLIVTVETVVMHLASAVHVPVVAMMRQTTPEWAPIDRDNSTLVLTQHFDDWVGKIDVRQVMEGLLRCPAAGQAAKRAVNAW
jgi:ADP-heptose:LPS heptosyltransferase